MPLEVQRLTHAAVGVAGLDENERVDDFCELGKVHLEQRKLAVEEEAHVYLRPNATLANTKGFAAQWLQLVWPVACSS